MMTGLHKFKNTRLTNDIIFRTILSLFIVVSLITISFIIAGRLNWTRGWAYIILFSIGQSIRTLFVKHKNPNLFKRRGKVGQGTKTWDKVLLVLFGLMYISTVIVAAFDERYQWSVMSGWLWFAGFVMYGVSVFIMCWSMSVNKHFEKTVRIQKDFGHQVIDSGPYKIARHPGYVGTILGMAISVPLLLGSWWAFVPAILSIIFITYRTFLEDETLRKELNGYEAYAQKVRYRLIPGVW
jgi:protein-S-isoprenylcysteine O-methyltransferase Ste14